MAWEDSGGPEVTVTLAAETSEFEAALERIEERLRAIRTLAGEVGEIMDGLAHGD